MVTQRITESMVKARMKWVSEASKISLELDHNGYGWTLYQIEGEQRRLKELAYSETTRGMFEVLKGMYELLMVMENGKK